MYAEDGGVEGSSRTSTMLFIVCLALNTYKSDNKIGNYEEAFVRGSRGSLKFNLKNRFTTLSFRCCSAFIAI